MDAEADGLYAQCFPEFASEGTLHEQVDVWRIDRKLIARALDYGGD
jgi:hypothetical protein